MGLAGYGSDGFDRTGAVFFTRLTVGKAIAADDNGNQTCDLGDSPSERGLSRAKSNPNARAKAIWRRLFGK